MTDTLELFNNLYEYYKGYNYFEYDDIILFDFVNVNDEIQTMKYIKNEDKIITFKDDKIEIKDVDRVETIFIETSQRYETYDEIKEHIRGLHSSGELSDNEYNYILQEWNNLLMKHNL